MLDFHGWTHHGACRAVSLALAAPMGLLLLIHPGAMVGPDGHYSHGLLMLVMAGICAGFVHGVGFSVTSRWGRWLTFPLPSWCLLVGGYLMLQVQWLAAGL
jgi:predicted membrane protein